MPQMAPLMWLNLYIFFSFSFLFFNVLNFFNFKYTPMMKKNETKNKENKTLMWKW